MSAARHAYGSPDVVAAASERRPGVAAGVLPLLILVIALAAATVWFVAVPALDRPPRVERSCEVFVLESGSTRCVPRQTAESLPAPGKAKPSGRAKP